MIYEIDIKDGKITIDEDAAKELTTAEKLKMLRKWQLRTMITLMQEHKVCDGHKNDEDN